MDVSQSVMDSLSLSEDAKDSSSDESGLRFALSLYQGVFPNCLLFYYIEDECLNETTIKRIIDK